MRRDDDYIREMLFEVEESDDHLFLATLAISSGDDDLKRHYHAELLCDAGYMLEVNKGVYRLTNQGHDYINVIRDDKTWNKVKHGATAVGGMTLQMMADLAIGYTKAKLQEATGVSLS